MQQEAIHFLAIFTLKKEMELFRSVTMIAAGKSKNKQMTNLLSPPKNSDIKLRFDFNIASFLHYT